jgi:P27 family predicted phage terminase small subunit
MGSGRKNIPSKIHQLKGTDRADRMNPDEPEYKSAGVVPTQIIKDNDAALEEWIRVAPSLCDTSVLTIVDIGTLERYCLFHARWIEAEALLYDEGLITTSINGHKQANPLISIANQAGINSNRLATELGITPASRSKVSADKSNKKNSNPFGKFKNNKTG